MLGCILKPIFHCDAKPFALGRGVVDTNMLVSKNAKLCVTPNAKPKRHNFALWILTCWYPKMLNYTLPLTRNPNASLWNIGRVGSPMQNFRVGHVHLIFLGVDFICVGSRFSVEYGLKRSFLSPLWSCQLKQSETTSPSSIGL